jgi:hypothetical protein
MSKQLNKALLVALTLLAVSAKAANPYAWSSTHTIFDAASHGCVTPKAAKKLKAERAEKRKGN